MVQRVLRCSQTRLPGVRSAVTPARTSLEASSAQPSFWRFVKPSEEFRGALALDELLDHDRVVGTGGQQAGVGDVGVLNGTQERGLVGVVGQGAELGVQDLDD